MSEDKRNIKWDTKVAELPEDISFDGIKGRLEKPQKYENEMLFEYDCRKLSDYAVYNPKRVSEVLDVYDGVLKGDVSEKVKDGITYSLGEMVSFRPELRGDVVEFGKKHHPLFENNLKNYNHLFSEEISGMNNEIKDSLKKEKVLDSLARVKGKINKDDVHTPIETKEDVKRDKGEVKKDISKVVMEKLIDERLNKP
ncbi:MAG: hypothetical protein IKW58_01875 [Alphaproteobacteria bacterium]|nr:hypothetical protein [Alphaproteobacteria bacterium]